MTDGEEPRKGGNSRADLDLACSSVLGAAAFNMYLPFRWPDNYLVLVRMIRISLYTV